MCDRAQTGGSDTVGLTRNRGALPRADLVGRAITVVAEGFCQAREGAGIAARGARVVGPFKDVTPVLRAVAVRVSCGTIDLDLGNEHTSRIALALFRKGTPPVFLSRETVHPLPDRLEAAPRFFKPPAYRSLMRVPAQIADSSGYRDEHLQA